MSPNEMIAAAIRQMNSEDLLKTYLKLSECLFRSLKYEDEKNTVIIGCEIPRAKLEVSITLEEKNHE